MTDNSLALVGSMGLNVSMTASKNAPKIISGAKEPKSVLRGASEGDKLFYRLLTAFAAPIEKFTPAAFAALNGALFEGYDGAGKLRTKQTVLEGSSFADASLIPGSLKRLLTKMCELGSAPECSKEDFAASLTHYFSELFLLCPFLNGGFITEAVFLARFAALHGFGVNYSKCGGARLYGAVKTAFFTDEKNELFVCLSEALFYLGSESGTKKKAKPAPKPKERRAVQSQEQKPAVKNPAKTKGGKNSTVGERSAEKLDLMDLPASVLKEAAEIKAQMEALEKRLKELLTKKPDNAGAEGKTRKRLAPRDLRPAPSPEEKEPDAAAAAVDTEGNE